MGNFFFVGGWLSSWWGGGKKEEKEAKGTTQEIAEKFSEAMTPEEKEKLYSAIGYSENMVLQTWLTGLISV